MRVISNKPGSSRERVDAEAPLVPIGNWRIAEGGKRHLVLPSQWGTGERLTDLWLTEQEALGIAKAVMTYLFDDAARRDKP